MNSKLLTSIIALATAIGIFWGAYWFVENRYALAHELQLTQLRQEQHITADSYKINRNNLWDLRKKCEKEGCTEEEQKELMELEETVDLERDKLKAIQQQMVK